MNRAVVKVAPILGGLIVGSVVLGLLGKGQSDVARKVVLAYRLEESAPVSFPLAPEDRDPALTLWLVAGTRRANLVLGAHDAAGAQIWRGQATLEAVAGPDRTRSGTALSAEQTLELSLPDGARRITVGLGAASGEPPPPMALVRLTRRAPRRDLWSNAARLDAATRRLADRLDPFGWMYVDEVRLDALRAAPTRRRSAGADDAPPPLERVVLGELPSPTSPVPGEPGEWLEPGRAHAWTVTGPGRLRLQLLASEPLSARIGTVNQRGQVTSREVPAWPHAELSLDVPAAGALTVTTGCDAAPGLRVSAFAEDGAKQLGTGQSGSIRPDRRRTPLWRVRPAGPKLTAILAGDGSARLTVRAVRAETTAAPRFAWRIFAQNGALLSSGQHTVAARPARFETWRRGPDAPGEPAAFVASAEPGARLELEALDAPLAVSLEAEGTALPAEVETGYSLDLEGVRLRFAPFRRRRFVPFRPEGLSALLSADDVLELEGQVRLEPVGSSSPAGPYQALLPSPPRLRQVLIEREERPRHWRRFHRAGFHTGETVRLRVPGAGPLAGRLVLDFLLGPEALGGELLVHVDGHPALVRRIALTRGQVRLRGLESGDHVIRVIGPPGLVLTTTPPAEASAAISTWAERLTWRLSHGAKRGLVVPVAMGSQARTLHVVLYGDRSRAGAWHLNALIDRGQAGPAVRQTPSRTRLSRRLSAEPEPTRTLWLDQTGGASALAVFPIRLGPDLGPGVHRVRITLQDGPARASARFFISGTAAEVIPAGGHVEWEVD